MVAPQTENQHWILQVLYGAILPPGERHTYETYIWLGGGQDLSLWVYFDLSVRYCQNGLGAESRSGQEIRKISKITDIYAILGMV